MNDLYPILERHVGHAIKIIYFPEGSNNTNRITLHCTCGFVLFSVSKPEGGG